MLSHGCVACCTHSPPFGIGAAAQLTGPALYPLLVMRFYVRFRALTPAECSSALAACSVNRQARGWEVGWVDVMAVVRAAPGHVDGRDLELDGVYGVYTTE